MEFERKCVTITWQVENIKYIHQLYSPVITIDVMEGTKWKLGFLRMTNRSRRIQYGLTITREVDDDGPEEIGLHYKFSVNRIGSSSNILTCIFQKNQSCSEVEINIRELAKSFTADTITIECKLWMKQGTIIKNDQFFVKTRMKMEHCIFTERVENYSDVSTAVTSFISSEVTLKTISSSTGESILSVSLNFFSPISESIMRGRETRMEIVFRVMDDQLNQSCCFELFILDSSGNKTDTGKLKGRFKLKPTVSFILPGLWAEELWEKSDQYLVDDALSLHCELTFCSGIQYENVERTENVMDSLAVVNESDFLDAVEFLTTRENILCDMKLQTDTVTFPTNTAILIAQSPVFEAMFKTNMKETIQNCVYIDDVDAETVKNMLLFLYSKTLEELDWKAAMNLYFAADKYQILTLKERCAALLKQSLDLSNCCVLLHLADMHQDIGLQKEVIEYIDRNHKEIIYCDQWKDLEKTLPHLAITFFSDRYLKKMFFFF